MASFEHGTLRIFYEEAGTGDPVLLLPGFSGSIADFSVLRQALVAAQYHVIAADLPGSGRSEPQPRDYPPTYYEDDADSISALLQHLAVEPTHVLGFSDGGEVALLLAALTPGATRSVATWGAAGILSDPDGHLREAMYNVVDTPIPPLHAYRDHLIASYGEANARTMTQNVVRAMSTIIDRGGDISLSKASTITCPVLLITGEHDFLAPVELLSHLAARIPTVEILKVEDAGHDVHNARPEWFAHTILDWLQRH
jgi:valacyclovir hydrolase